MPYRRFGKHDVELFQALLDSFPSVEELSQFTQSELGLNLQEISNNEPLVQAVRALIDWAILTKRERALLAAASRARPEDDWLQLVLEDCGAHLDRVAPEPWYKAPDPFDAYILGGKIAFFNRSQLRESVKELLSPEGRNVLVVRGEGGSGCSHSLHLIKHLAAELEAFQVIGIDLRAFGRELMPYDLVRHMAIHLKCHNEMDFIPSQHGQAARWSLDLSAWFQGQVDERDHQTWVVIDGMDHSRPHEETVGLIERLAILAEDTALRLRFVLLGWTDPLAAAIEAAALHDEVEVFDEEALVEFFTQVFVHQAQPIDSAAIERAVEHVQELAGTDTDKRLERVSRAAVEVARELSISSGTT